MKCDLCRNNIEKYNPNFNHFVIDETHSINVCPKCIDKFIKWQSQILATLFPTTALKKRFEKNH
ncbi:MAG: hypothetical protein WC376_02730 [Candidatus Nanoarchaeia archaeon]|jgi:hypothetical protein